MRFVRDSPLRRTAASGTGSQASGFVCGAEGPDYSTTAMQSTSTSMPRRAAATVVRAGGSWSKNSL